MLYDPKWEAPAVETPTEPLEPWRQLLLDAADTIDERGHAKGVLENRNGGVCLVGALYVAGHGTRRALSPAGQVALDRMCGFMNLPVWRLVNWNNAPERKADEVTGMMRAAAWQ